MVYHRRRHQGSVPYTIQYLPSVGGFFCCSSSGCGAVVFQGGQKAVPSLTSFPLLVGQDGLILLIQVLQLPLYLGLQ